MPDSENVPEQSSGEPVMSAQAPVDQSDFARASGGDHAAKEPPEAPTDPEQAPEPDPAATSSQPGMASGDGAATDSPAADGTGSAAADNSGTDDTTPAEPPAEPPAALTLLPPSDNGPPDASVRIMCPREQRCLWAGFELPDREQHPDPAAEVRAAAGCLDDPPTCVCTAAEQDRSRALLDAAAVTPSVLVAGQEVSLPTPIGVLRARMDSDGPAPVLMGDDLTAAGVASGTVSSTVSATVVPQLLTTAQAQGLDRAERPMREVIALGGFEVSEVLGRLGLEVPPVLEATTQGEEAQVAGSDAPGDA